MSLGDLSEQDRQVVQACLDCVATGEVILHDAEFCTIMGVDPAEFMDVCNAWPDVSENEATVQCSVENAMNNLLGYPHEWHDAWDSKISVSKMEIHRVLSLWRGDRPDSHFAGLL